MQWISRMRRYAAAMAVASGAIVWSSPADAVTMSDLAVFGENGVIIGANVTVHHGGVGSNDQLGFITLGNGGEYLLVTGGGTLTVGANNDIVGNIVVNDDLAIGSGAVVVGNIDTAGDVSLGSNSQVLADGGVGGNITAAGNVAIGNGSFVENNILAGGNVWANSNSHVGGDIGSNGHVILGSNTQIDGNIRYGQGDNYTPGANVTVGGSIVEGPDTPVHPAAYTPLSLPGPSIISPGAVSHSVGANTGLVLSPDAYNQISLGANSELFLNSGRYDLGSLSLGNGADVFFDLSTGAPISIFVDSNLNFGNNTEMFVRSAPGDDYLSFSDLLDDDSLTWLVESIYWEVHGDVNLGNGGEWLGTLMHLGDGSSGVNIGANADIFGAVYSNDVVNIGNGSDIHYAMASDLLQQLQGPDGQNPPPAGPVATPEPVSAVLSLIGLAGLGAATRRRRG